MVSESRRSVVVRGVPGALKNAIDWDSRPYGDNAFAGLPIGIVGATIGAPGTSMAQQHLRNIPAYLASPTLGHPEAYIQYTEDRFGPDGEIRDDETREFSASSAFVVNDEMLV